MSEPTLARLLQLSSPTLPVGAFSYSQGLESAVEVGLVHDEASAGSWLATVLRQGVAAWDATWVAALMRAWQQHNDDLIVDLNERFLASRESRESWEETAQMGRSLLAALRQRPDMPRQMLTHLQQLDSEPALSYPVAWSAAAASSSIAVQDALVGYLWAWLENAVMAALKLVPLGQFAGQRLLARLGAELDTLALRATSRPLDHCCNLLPGLTLACMHHETQYSRLFRS